MKLLDFTPSDVDELFEVLHIIVGEFETDPTSVQCFDLRVVERAKKITKRLFDVNKRYNHDY